MSVLLTARHAAAALLLVCLAGCGAPVATPTTDPGTTSPSAAASTPRPSIVPTASPVDRVAGWRSDLALLLPGMEALHPDLFHGTPRATMAAAIADLEASAADATDAELLVGVMRVVALVSAAGRDGHTGAYAWGSGTFPLHSLPLRLWWFTDGLGVVDALPPYEALVGLRVTSLAGHPVADVLAAIDPLVPRDNPETVVLSTPRFVLIPEVLAGLGLASATGPVELGLEDLAGATSTASVTPIAMRDYNDWATPYGLFLPSRAGSRDLERMDEPLWFERIDRSHALYVQYNSVDGATDTMIFDLHRALAEPGIRRVVVDIRNNYGGETAAIRPMLDELEAARQPLVLVTGRNTFSAATLFAAELERTRQAVFVGEPMGGSPTFYANSRSVQLPFSGLSIDVSTHFYVGSTPDDPRLEIAPRVVAARSIADYLEGRDPALEAALAVEVAP